MSKLNAAELLARVRKRKQELLDQPSEGSGSEPAPKQQKNPYLEPAESAQLAAPKPRLALESSQKLVRVTDESELLYLPAPLPSSSKEWWDANPVEITSLVYKPSQIGLPKEHGGTEGVTLHLTADERRRKRKQERLVKRQDAQERVRLGIDPPPPPKLRFSNVASVFGAEFVKDPTRYEELARQSENERRETHERANKERQLTPEQRWSKHEAKVESHRSRSLRTAVFRIEHLDESTGKQCFLVDYTAKKFLFTGAVLMGSPALVIVEGGEPEVAKFAKLVTRKVEGCTLLWEGFLARSHFKAWSLHNFPSESLKRDFLRNHHSLAYYLLMYDALSSEL